ncbi:hypothetical protein [Ohtaekwangia koreensis]|uniref:DUF5689 domain-containing protein n=1 Tax=Ohtaekwangia koreensis TaxID=688867 RepID=A0A1T5LTC9_9BACT|nr:hypothetical protein [Ohtaekwangia koreensis]SKC79267.1 hypothetical protein SAMN05660236_3899 [Ohtaekwangia koreensis]
MKRNIKVFSITVLALSLIWITYSCVEPDDLITEDAKEGGAIVAVTGSSGKVLGVPDATTGEVTFTDNDLSLIVNKKTGGSAVESYAVVKQYNGGAEVVVEEFETTPHTVELTTLSEFLNGTGKQESDLRIGDVFTFTVRQTLEDGRIIYSAPANGRYNVTVNCSSNLAGTYTVTGVYNRPASGITGQAVGPRTEVISEISPGVYGTQLTGHWTLADLGVSECPIIFSDVCGELTIATQTLCDAYSNEVSGTGYVDAATGNLFFEYIITGGNERSYTFTFAKQ